MLYAISKDKKIEATPKATGKCPACDESLMPKCGELKIWHWAHFANANCRFSKEPETEWHIAWKKEFPKEQAERIVTKNGKVHVADIKTPYGMVIEFQHSSIDSGSIWDRESAYGLMVWVFDAQEAWDSDRLRLKRDSKGDYLLWEQPKWSWTACKKPVYLDLDGERLFKVSDRFLSNGDFGADFELIGDFISREDLLESWRHIPGNCRIWCSYRNKIRLTHYEVCGWHRDEKDPECEKCDSIPFLASKELIKAPILEISFGINLT